MEVKRYNIMLCLRYTIAEKTRHDLMLSTYSRFLVAQRGVHHDMGVICCQPFGVGGALYQIQM